MTNEPLDLRTALAGIDRVWSPHIAARVNDYDVRVANVRGEHIWHSHEETDEFFLVLDGEFRIELRDGAPGEERTVVVPTGSIFVVPRGIEHRPSSDAGASILMFEATGTSSVGERHESVPDHVDVTTGHTLP